MGTAVYVFPAVILHLREPETPEAMICACWRDLARLPKPFIEASVKIFDKSGIPARTDPNAVTEGVTVMCEQARNGAFSSPYEYILTLKYVARRIKLGKPCWKEEPNG